MKLFKNKGYKRYEELVKSFNSKKEELEIYKSGSDYLKDSKREMRKLAENLKVNFKKYDDFTKAEIGGRLVSMKKEYDRDLANAKFTKENIEKSISKILKEQSSLLNNKEVLKAISEGVEIQKPEVKEYCDNIVMSGNEILLLRRTKDEEDKSSALWTIPGGHRDDDNWLIGAQREFVEETGIPLEDVIKPETDEEFSYYSNKFKLVGEYNKGGVKIKYYRTDLDKNIVIPTLQGEEIDDFEWVKLCELFKEDSEYMMPFDMKDNLKKIFERESEFVKEDEKVTLLKAEEEEIKKGEVEKEDEEIIEKAEPKEEDKIEGGKADKLSIKDIAEKHKVKVSQIVEQLQQGIKVEMEHTNDEEKSKEIALDHLTESPEYYTKLKKMEDSFEKGETKKTKEEVDYIDPTPLNTKCSGCNYFDGRKSCLKVEGEISKEGYCSLWNLKGQN